VQGNADVNEDLIEALPYECKKFDSHILKLNIDGRRIGIVHRVKKDDVFENLDIVFSGHYHSKDLKMINFLKFVRPGALINGNNFAIYETTNNEVEFVEDVQI
jgi:predicted phosphodiesterase